jgi:ABC-2 type transport system ATP-binding protein
VLSLDTARHSTEILARVGYLPSETPFYYGMKVCEMLELSARLRGVSCKNEADILCERLELDPTKRVGELSFGNRKKMGIVAAFQHKPALYVLDEPTSGLDPLMQKEFYSIVKERNDEGATVFLSSHILSEVERYCKTAAVIKDGRLLACDSVENLGHTGVKRVTLRGITDIPQRECFGDVKREGDTVTFLYEGKSPALLSELASLSFEDFTVSDPDLEEVFMHYYEREGK